MRSPSSMIAFLFFAVLALLATVQALPQAPPIPPPGLFCCPPYGPKGQPLVQPQPGPFVLWCLYGQNSLCGYNTASGDGSTTPGCPPKAIHNPHPPKCPVWKHY
ncbi:hypothetical protein DFP72DRAFT_529827 [Ephemerocybe angulata]|uniref:Uncharacterized protein n=1 Tax=Ephemerocybe angulata TaxID=980116 RepID=A0A8H6IFG6_9AGAR|nr:hypothetical protein DFP72DRAFT_529827 [Tulosesus angulatus]